MPRYPKRGGVCVCGGGGGRVIKKKPKINEMIKIRVTRNIDKVNTSVIITMSNTDDTYTDR